MSMQCPPSMQCFRLQPLLSCRTAPLQAACCLNMLQMLASHHAPVVQARARQACGRRLRSCPTKHQPACAGTQDKSWVVGSGFRFTRACRYYDARQWQQEAARLDSAARKPALPASPAASSGGGGSALGSAPAAAKRKSTVGPAAARSAQLERQVRPASRGRTELLHDQG